LDLYPFFFRFKEHIPTSVDLEELSRETGIDISILASLKGAALRYDSIYNELTINMGYSDDQVPFWFKKPRRIRRKSKDSTIHQSVNVQNPSPEYALLNPLVDASLRTLAGLQNYETEPEPETPALPFSGPIRLGRINIDGIQYYTINVNPGPPNPFWQYTPQQPPESLSISPIDDWNLNEEAIREILWRKQFHNKIVMDNMILSMHLNQYQEDALSPGDVAKLVEAFWCGYQTIFKLLNDRHMVAVEKEQIVQEEEKPKLVPLRMLYEEKYIPMKKFYS
jgi:hypothetical protein